MLRTFTRNNTTLVSIIIFAIVFGIINPKILDRTIFLYSSDNLKGYLSTHKFYKEFHNKVKKHYFKNTLEYTKHIELIDALSF